MPHKIICISRQYGSGGHEIAIRLAKRLHIKVYEKELLEMACRQGDVPQKLLEKSDERAENRLLYEAVHEGSCREIQGMSTSAALFQLQCAQIRRIAAKEDCIIVGRCADYILRDSGAQVLKVFVAAPEEKRVLWKMNQEKLPLAKARRLVGRMDNQRRKYYQSYTGRIWGKPDNYDLCIDTGEQSLDEAVEIIAVMFDEL